MTNDELSESDVEQTPLPFADARPGQASRSQRSLRIAYVTPTFPPYRAGMGNVAYQHGLHVARLGHRVDVLTPRLPWARDAECLGLPVTRLFPLLRVRQASFTPTLVSRLRGYDLVHLHCPFVFGAQLVWLAHALWKTPYVVTYHQDLVLPGMLRPAAHTYRYLERLVLRRARWVAATTDDYAQHSDLHDFPRDRLTEMPNGVDIETFRPGLDAGELRRRYRLHERDRIVLFVGALDRAHYFKGVPLLLTAVARLSDIRLLIVGEGDLRRSYEQAAAAAGLNGRVRFVGAVSDRELPLHYALSDVVVLPSTTRGEAFGLVLLEAMASGIPVVASHLPGVRAVVDHGRNGLLVPPGDSSALAAAIADLLGDPARRVRMGHDGRRKVESVYDWRLLASQLEQLYLRALDGPPDGYARSVS
jgi:glycosyltransferase involved in cell wall biosynthesis